MGLFSSLIRDVPVPSYYNTDTMFDLLTGDFVRGYDGKYYLNGGLGNHITGVFGAGNCYKSTAAISFMSRGCALFPGGDGLALDTEGSQDNSGSRFVKCAGNWGPKVNLQNIDFISGVGLSMAELLVLFQAVGQKKLNSIKDYTIETPFVNHKTGKRILAWTPTFLLLDSVTELMSNNETTLLEAEGLEGDKTKTIFMVDGQQKTIFIRHLRRYCELYGFVVIGTTQVGDNINIGGYLPPPKKTQFMTQKQALKGVGSRFYYLTKTLIEMSSPTILQEGKGKDAESTYGSLDEKIPADDLNEVMIKVIRGKGNRSGIIYPLVFSQTYGFQAGLTAYHYLRKNEYAGLIGSSQNNASAWYPNLKVSRNKVRNALATDTKFERSLALISQMLFLQQYTFRIPTLKKTWDMTPEQLYARITKDGSSLADDILASRSCWCAPNVDDRPYMSVLDVMELVERDLTNSVSMPVTKAA